MKKTVNMTILCCFILVSLSVVSSVNGEPFHIILDQSDASHWFGGDNRPGPGTQGRNVGVGQSIILGKDGRAGSVGFKFLSRFDYKDNPTGYGHEVTLVLNARTSVGDIIYTVEKVLSASFNGGWVIFDVDVYLQGGQKYIFTCYLKDGMTLQLTSYVLGHTQDKLPNSAPYFAIVYPPDQDIQDWKYWHPHTTMFGDFNFQISGVFNPVLPVADADGPYTGVEGSAITFDGTGSYDPDGTVETYNWNFGDGGTGTGETPGHTYADNGIYTVSLTVTDNDGLTSPPSFTTATVSNVNPVVNAGPDHTVTVFDTVVLNGSFTDAGTDDIHAATINWGDGTPVEPGIVTEVDGSGTVSGSHVYVDASGSPYTITLTVIDDDTGLGNDTASVTVNSAPPVLSGIPDQSLDENTSLDNAIDLWAYASDPDNPDSELTFDIIGNTQPDCGVSIDSNRYIDINPTADWSGTSDVTVKVTDPSGLFDTDTFTVTVNPVDDPPNWAVIVGVADYPDTVSDLEYPDDDAMDMKNSLLAYSNWDEDVIQLLLDSEATKANIQAAIEYMGSMASEDDVCLFFFSGHGTNATDVDPIDEADGLDEYICAHDADIRDDELSDWLAALPTTNVVVVVDTCFSGGQVKAADGFTSRLLPGTTGIVQKGDGFDDDMARRIHVDDMDDNPGCVVMTACDDDELSWEFGGLENGLFTYFVVSALEKNKDINGNGELSGEEIGRYARLIVNLLSWKLPSLDQHPQLHDDYPAGMPEADELSVCIGVPAITDMAHGYDADDIIGQIPTPGVVSVPESAMLLQNFPSPFNPDTWIPYQLKQYAHVSISIHTASGQLVRTLNLGHKAAGFYTVKDNAAYWDGRNEAGELVSSGIYFYTIQAGEFTATKKMVIAR